MSPERMDRLVMSDYRYDFLMRLGGGHERLDREPRPHDRDHVPRQLDCNRDLRQNWLQSAVMLDFRP
jgi:hypothetical protein